MCGSFLFSLVFKNEGLFSCFHIGIVKRSSNTNDFLSGATGDRYGTPKDIVVESKDIFINRPTAIPKNPAKEP